MNLEGRYVLITGAAGGTGVGAGVVEAVIEAGGCPLINGRDCRKLAEARERFPSAELIQGDISVAEDAQRMVIELEKRIGRIHYLVNNAGIGLHAAPHECGEADFDRLVNIDFRGTWLMTKAWLAHVLGAETKANPPAAAVNISSVHAQKTMPGYGIYAGAKGAVDSFTRGLAVHYGRLGVRFNTVSPGYVHSDQNMDLIRHWTEDPAGWVSDLIHNHQAIPEPIEPVDVGRVVVFLLSDQSTAVTGQMITVDGGSTSLLYPMNFV